MEQDFGQEAYGTQFDSFVLDQRLDARLRNRLGAGVFLEPLVHLPLARYVTRPDREVVYRA
jgi:hypothetical protein